MNSINFEILRKKWPELASLGGFAEQYSYSDPSSALIKLRTFCEHLVADIYQIHGLQLPYQHNLFDLLNEDVFKATVPDVVVSKLDLVRRAGNKAAHGQKPQASQALLCLRDASDIAKWLFVTYSDGKLEECSEFKEPPPVDTKAKIKKEKKAALEKLAHQEAQLQELLQQVESLRIKTKAAEKTEAELQALKAAGQTSADVLNFSEATTRKRLIDLQLAEAGWNVGANGKSTDEVGQEVEVEHQPTKTGFGKIDYVLWDDNGKPLAVIEAKKTAESPEKGRTQARYYADGMEKEYGQRPVIFYTNGFDIFIWDDGQNYPDRRVFGYYSKDSLQYLVTFQRDKKKLLENIEINPGITDRDYQQEAIRRTTERFTNRYRKALIIQATGTGKTRVAISLADLLIRANWCKRVLFLCDRKELRKQAKGAFLDHLDNPSCTIVTRKTHKERHHRVYLATYPAMIRLFQTFDVGFFDLIIADESHRSIYNRYKDLFLYFDSFQVGLTATPVNFITRNTFRLFGCEDKDPTFHYSLEQGVEAGYLSPYEVFTHTTNFLRKGIKYADLTEEQKQQLEEDGENPEDFDYENREIDSKIFNKETNRAILNNLMDNGIREASGQHVGKSIVFARSHDHAILLKELFDEMYPQYGGKFCQVIDNYDPKAEQLIDDFKSTEGKEEITIAISVDMLDTGIDIPEILNLVFAKPLRSQVKFDQMIGRGTRLCPNLFGPGKDKKKFWIFDHWGNFEYFSKKPKEAEPSQKKSLLQILFEERVELAQTAIAKQNREVFEIAIEEIEKMMNTLPDKTIAIKKKWQQVHRLKEKSILQAFSATTVQGLLNDIGPLMQWINTSKQTDAYRLDLLMTKLEKNWLKQSTEMDDLKAELRNGTAILPINLNQVVVKEETINQVRSDEFWTKFTILDLEKVRSDLRGIWQFRTKTPTGKPETKVIDIADGDQEFNNISTGYVTVDMAAYRKRVEETLLDHFASNPTLQKIRQGVPVSEEDLETLNALILTQNPDVDLNTLKSFYEGTAVSLDFILRSIIGMDEDAVEGHFKAFREKHNLNANQLRFMSLLKSHIAKYGSIEIEKLYEPPFTGIDSDGVDGIFPQEKDVDDLLEIIATFAPDQTTA